MRITRLLLCNKFASMQSLPLEVLDAS